MLSTRTVISADSAGVIFIRYLIRFATGDVMCCGGDERGEFVHNDCIFCKIAAKEIPVKIIYEDDHVLAFPDINPMAPVHILVIPKQHFDSLLTVKPEEMPIVAQVMAALPAVAEKAGVTGEGFRIVVNTGGNGGQTVNHLHWHLLGGRIMSWPPG
ncbi:MAG: HIT-like protein [Firmicutes bacterium]|nr:HIT-like protein [Bacillota bacterium]